MKAAERTAKAKTLSKQRQKGKLGRALTSLGVWEEELRSYYETYVRIHRLRYECDPDPAEVPNEWPSIDD